MCEEEDASSLFFDDDFVRENLNFLMEDDLFDIIEQGTSLHYRSYEEENSIYNNAKIISNLRTSWSSSSSGSISSVKEQDSKFVNVCLRCERSNRSISNSTKTSKFSLSDVDFGESSLQYDDNSFLLDFPSGLTSTPTKTAGINKFMVDGLHEATKGGKVRNRLQLESGLEATSVQKQKVIRKELLDDSTVCDLNCTFCFKNGEPIHVYKSHNVRNLEGIVVCPILRRHVCEVCGQTGDNAHTRKYCPIYHEDGHSKRSSRLLSNGVRTSNWNHK